MRFAFLLFLMLSAGASFSQTKKIALKSHSGEIDELSISGAGNLGLGYVEMTPDKRKTSKVDTVTKQAMIYDSVSTYNFILKQKEEKTEKKKPKSIKK